MPGEEISTSRENDLVSRWGKEEAREGRKEGPVKEKNPERKLSLPWILRLATSTCVLALNSLYYMQPHKAQKEDSCIALKKKKLLANLFT